MKVECVSTYYDYQSEYAILVDGKEEFRVGDGEPEDNTLGRNFNDVYKVVDLIKMAYQAGLSREELLIEERHVDEEA